MPVAVAKDGFGPDGRKKLKKAGVPTNFPLKGGDRAAEQDAERLRSEDLHAAGIRAILPGKDLGFRSNHGHGIGESQTGGIGEFKIVGQQLRIGGVDVHRAIQFQSAGVLVTDADFPRAGDFLFNREVALLRVAVAEVFRYRQGERQDGQRKTSRQIILIGKQGIGQQGIEALFVRQITQVGQAGGVQNTLKDGRAIQIAGAVEGRCCTPE